MKLFGFAAVTSLLLSGCAHYASYDDLGGYGGSYTSYSVGVSSGYPAYGYGYAPMYRAPYSGHRHYHGGHSHGHGHHKHHYDRHHGHDRGGKGGHDHDGKRGDHHGGKPAVHGKPPGGGARLDRGGPPGGGKVTGSGPRPDRS